MANTEYCTCGRHKYYTPMPKPPPVPAAPFRLLDLPREIRDLIYAYALTPIHTCTEQPLGIKWSLSSLTKSKYSNAKPVDISLLLISRQVSTEAAPILVSSNSLRLGSYYEHKRVENTIRLFPNKHMRNVRVIVLTYHYRNLSHQRNTRSNWQHPTHWPRSDASGLWATIISDALMLKDYFPALRRFEAVWFFKHGGGSPLRLLGRYNANDVGRGAQCLLEWLRECYKLDSLKPPMWLAVRWQQPGYVKQEHWDLALENFRSEIEVAGDDKQASAQDESWLDEFDDRKRVKKGKKKG